MSAIPYSVAALVLTGMACTTGLATSKAARGSDALVCELRLSESNRQVTVAAHAQAHEAMRGTYALEIEQRSSGGRATIRQGGEFDLRAGEKAVLGEARLAGRARDLTAELTVTANGKTRTCGAAEL